MAEEAPPPIRLMNFVSEEQLDEAKKNRGERVEDGTAQRDRPLFDILKDNKDKKDAEFNERFKHRPPKALDEDETEFLDNLEMSKREYEQQIANEEAQELRRFQAAMAAQSTFVRELQEVPPVQKVQERESVGKKNPPARPLGMIIKVKPQAKKAKLNPEIVEESSKTMRTPDVNTEKSTEIHNVAKSALVSYSDESEEDD